MKKQKIIKFSIIVPVYNAEAYLEECIESILHQTYSCYEIILVNDGSLDTSGEICNKYAKSYVNIFVYHKENKGQLHTRQYGIDRACGDYCVFLDADDYLDADALEIIATKVNESDCDCVIYGMKRVKDGQVISRVKSGETCIILDKRELYRKCLFSSEYNSMCRKAAKTELLRGITWDKFYAIRYGEDLIQSVSLLKECNKVLFIENEIYNYRFNESSVTNSIDLSNIDVDNCARTYSVTLLKQEQVFTEQDFSEYRSYCIKSLVKKIYRIAISNGNRKKKIELYEKIKQTEYYQEFITNGKYSRVIIGNKYLVYELFKKGNYDFLVSLIELREWLNKLVRKM